jgi:hypothetical protein
MRGLFSLFSSAGISPEYIEGIKKGQVFIPGRRMLPVIEKAVSEVEGVRLRDCELSPDNIRLMIEVKKSGAHLTFPLIINISGVRINSQEQKIDLNILTKRPVGENYFGRFISHIAGGFLSRIMNKRISSIPLVELSETHKKGRRLVIDLSSIDKIQSLKKPLPFLKGGLLDLITIQGIEHVSGGVNLKAALSLQSAIRKVFN